MANYYCDITAIKLRYDNRTIKQLSNDEDTYAQVNGRIDAALDDAASELDTYLEGRWPVSGQAPTWTRPQVLTRACSAIAMGHMFGVREDEPPKVKSERTWVDGWLMKLAEGLISLPGEPRANAPELLASRSFKGCSIVNVALQLGFPPTSTSADGQQCGANGDC